MNRFEIEGKIVRVEMKRGPRQIWYLAFVEAESQLVGVPVFGSPPQVGGNMWATGKLGTHDGYLRLLPEQIKSAKPVKAARKGVPAAQPTKGGTKPC